MLLQQIVQIIKGESSKIAYLRGRFLEPHCQPADDFHYDASIGTLCYCIYRGVKVDARIMVDVAIEMGFDIFSQIINQLGSIYSLNPPLMALFPSATVFNIVIFTMKKAKT
jgi:hypothetical protein